MIFLGLFVALLARRCGVQHGPSDRSLTCDRFSGAFLAPFWLPFGALWLPFGSLWFPFRRLGSLLPPLRLRFPTFGPSACEISSIIMFFKHPRPRVTRRLPLAPSSEELPPRYLIFPRPGAAPCRRQIRLRCSPIWASHFGTAVHQNSVFFKESLLIPTFSNFLQIFNPKL